MLYNLMMEEKFESIANEYDKWFDTPIGATVKALELDAILGLLGDITNKKLLEVGIGTGAFAVEFKKRGAEVYGIDPANNMLEIAQKRGLIVKFGYGEAVPFEDNTFDVVVSITAMENSKDPDKFVKEMVRVAKPHGTIVIAVLNLFSLMGISRRIRGLFIKDDFYRGMHFYTYGELRGLAKNNICFVHETSAVFFNQSPPQFVLTHAQALEKFGRKYLKPFGALIIIGGKKCS